MHTPKKREIKLQSKREDKIDRAVLSAMLFMQRINDEDKENVDPQRHLLSLKRAKQGKHVSGSKGKKMRERPPLS